MASSLSDSLRAALDASRRNPNAFVVGPGFTVKWDMEREGSEISAEFHIKKRRAYLIEILFRSTSGSASELFPFTGDGSTVLVRREEADSDNPAVIPTPTPEAVRRSYEHITSGEYVRTSSRNCVVIPVHLNIERLFGGGAPTVEIDRDFKTRGIRGSFSGFHGTSPRGLARRITEVDLKRGSYRITARTLAPTAVPANVETYLLLRYRVVT